MKSVQFSHAGQIDRCLRCPGMLCEKELTLKISLNLCHLCNLWFPSWLALLVCLPALANPQQDSSDWKSVNDFAYQLQNADLNAIGKTKFDLVVIDYSRDGSEGKRFSAEDISKLKNSEGGKKIVLSYISIGEAESYRSYWKPEWEKSPPAWLGPENPEWKGNYKVKYWDRDWQAIVFKYLDKIIEAGFDGAYLDIIDAYEFWGPGGESDLNRKTAEQEMVDFVKAIAKYCRETKGKKPFGIFPQNGDPLASHKDYVDVVTGIGREDTWYEGNKKHSDEHTSEILRNLDVFKKAGKLVLVIDYPTQKKPIDDFYSMARSKGFVPYATTRPLDKLKINDGHEPD